MKPLSTACRISGKKLEPLAVNELNNGTITNKNLKNVFENHFRSLSE